jgi:hypothetical protein
MEAKTKMTPERYEEMYEDLNSLWERHRKQELDHGLYTFYCGKFAAYLMECLQELNPSRKKAGLADSNGTDEGKGSPAIQ